MTSALETLKRPVKRLIRLGVLFAAVGALVNLVPFIGLTELSRLLLAGTTDSQALWRWATLVVLALSLGWMASGVALWLTHLADHRLQASLREAMVRKLGRVPLGWYTDTTSVPCARWCRTTWRICTTWSLTMPWSRPPPSSRPWPG